MKIRIIRTPNAAAADATFILWLQEFILLICINIITSHLLILNSNLVSNYFLTIQFLFYSFCQTVKINAITQIISFNFIYIHGLFRIGQGILRTPTTWSQDSQQFLSNLDIRDEGSEDDEFFAFEKYPRTATFVIFGARKAGTLTSEDANNWDFWKIRD